MIRVCDDAGNVIETHEYKGDFKSGELSYAECLDSFDALRLKNVYAPKRKQGESEY